MPEPAVLLTLSKIISRTKEKETLGYLNALSAYQVTTKLIYSGLNYCRDTIQNFPFVV